MSGPFAAVRVTDRVWWVGAVDWGVRDFHGYSTNRGSTYNAYLVLGDKITLIDTVKAPFCDELLARVSSVIRPEQIDYIVSNHAELDHSGALAEVIRVTRPERVFASTMGARALAEHFTLDCEVSAVADGDKLDLGGAALTFIETRMLHWPDSMFSFLDDGGILFSSDAFGMHLASAGRFDDEISDWEYEAQKYFANILLPYSHLVARLLRRVQDSGLPIRIIAPDHGPIWRENPGRIIERYAAWSDRKPVNRAVVTFDTMWQSTSKMARAVAEGLWAAGTEPVVMSLGSCHRSEVVAELLTAGAIVVGSPTLNNNVFPTIADLLTYLTGLRPTGLAAAAFGSYGWSGEAVSQIETSLERMKLELAGEGVRAKYVPTVDDLSLCKALGERISERLAGV